MQGDFNFNRQVEPEGAELVAAELVAARRLQAEFEVPPSRGLQFAIHFPTRYCARKSGHGDYSNHRMPSSRGAPLFTLI
jgi:hypothetical protein